MKRMGSAFAIFALMILAFSLQPLIGIEPGIIGMIGMALMLAIYRPETKKLMSYFLWDTILELVGLFILCGTLKANGVLDVFGRWLLEICHHQTFAVCMILLWGVALLSMLVDSIPLALCFVPILTGILIPDLGLSMDGAENPLYWALLFGLCLGGSGSLLGASSNMMVKQLAERNGYYISGSRFFLWGFPQMIIQLLFCTLYLWYRYFPLDHP